MIKHCALALALLLHASTMTPSHSPCNDEGLEMDDDDSSEKELAALAAKSAEHVAFTINDRRPKAHHYLYNGFRSDDDDEYNVGETITYITKPESQLYVIKDRKGTLELLWILDRKTGKFKNCAKCRPCALENLYAGQVTTRNETRLTKILTIGLPLEDVKKPVSAKKVGSTHYAPRNGTEFTAPGAKEGETIVFEDTTAGTCWAGTVGKQTNTSDIHTFHIRSVYKSKKSDYTSYNPPLMALIKTSTYKSPKNT